MINCNSNEKIKARAVKVKEYLGKLSTQEILSILRKSDKVIGIPGVRYLNLELLHDIAYQTCLIDTQSLVDFEIAIGEKFEPDSSVKVFGDKHFAVYPIKDRIEQRDLFKKIDKNYAEEMKKEMNRRYGKQISFGEMFKNLNKIVSDDEMDSENSSFSIEDEIKKAIQNQFDVDVDNIEVKTDDEGYNHVNITSLLNDILGDIHKKVDDLQESEEDVATDNRLETYVTEMVTKNKYFDLELRDHLYESIDDIPYDEVILPFFEKYIDYMELQELYKGESIFVQDDLEIRVINCVREFIFSSAEQKYFIEFVISLYRYFK